MLTNIAEIISVKLLCSWQAAVYKHTGLQMAALMLSGAFN